MTPNEATAAPALFRILAIQLGRFPRYSHLLTSLSVIWVRGILALLCTRRLIAHHEVSHNGVPGDQS